MELACKCIGVSNHAAKQPGRQGPAGHGAAYLWSRRRKVRRKSKQLLRPQLQQHGAARLGPDRASGERLELRGDCGGCPARGVGGRAAQEAVDLACGRAAGAERLRAAM